MIHNHHPITRGLGRAAKRWPLLAALTGACVLGPTTALAANPAHPPAHDTFSVSPDTLCGFTGTSYWVVDFSNNGPAVGAHSVRTFVADNGRGVKITFQAGAGKLVSTVTNPDGSSSETFLEDGAFLRIEALGGPLLEQSTGRVTFTVNFDANGNIVSQTASAIAGPENSTGGLDCSVIGPYLAGS